ncbi:MAG: hypothetical protein ACRC8A_15355 [Microcoleaceae cyanobacterium]
MVTFSDDEVGLIRSLLIALRTIKVRDIDKALVILSKGDRRLEVKPDPMRSSQSPQESSSRIITGNS